VAGGPLPLLPERVVLELLEDQPVDGPLLGDRDLVVLAEKVETAPEAQAAVALGATLLQGFHVARPESVPARPLTGSRLAAARSAVSLSASADFDDVSGAVLRRAGPLGGVLEAAIRIAEGAGAATAEESAALRDALVWADGALPPRS
jgi:hypothetical protein